MSRSDVFTLKNTGLNRFLFAEVGTETNGSMLTVLSVLARLGEDPWTQAAQWMRLPKKDIIDCLTQSIAQMPLPPQALHDARQTATRLVKLLPAKAITSEEPSDTTPLPSTWPRWAPAAVIAAITLAISLGGALIMSPNTKEPALAPFALTEPATPSAPSN